MKSSRNSLGVRPERAKVFHYLGHLLLRGAHRIIRISGEGYLFVSERTSARSFCAGFCNGVAG